MKPRYALIPVIIGAVYLLAAALIVIFSGGATLSSGNLSISIHSLRSPISVFWALFIISAVLLSIKKSESTPDSAEHQQKTDQRALQRIELIVLILLFTAALAVRVYKITLPPLDFHPTRQYNNAIIARQLYCNTLQGPDDRWKHGFYNVGELFLEPPVSEMTAVLGYLVLGYESLIVPRLLSSLCWLAGGIALYCAMRRLSGRQGAFFGTLLFLFLPYAIASSRCFMPDPIMVSALCFYILAIVRYADRPSIGNLIFSIVAAAFTIFLKGMSVFIIFGGAFALLLYRAVTERRWKENITTGLIFLAATAIPVSLYAHFFLGREFKGRLFGRFLPNLTFTLFPYIGWLNMVDSALGIVFLAMALCALRLFNGAQRALLSGMMLGYLLFSLIFNYHCATHDYYHMPLIPLAAILGGAFIARVIAAVEVEAGKNITRVMVFCLTGILMLAFIAEGASKITRQECDAQISLAREMGSAVGHSRNTILLAPYYGDLIKYYGWVEGTPWPDSRDLQYWEWEGRKLRDSRELLKKWIENRHFRYFMVADMKEFRKQSELAAFLESTCPVIWKSDEGVIYDLSEKKPGNS